MQNLLTEQDVRIPLKWGTNSGDVGQRRSEATLVTATAPRSWKNGWRRSLWAGHRICPVPAGSL